MQAFLNRWMPIDVSAHGAPLDRLNTWVHWLMLVLFVGWGIYFVYVLVRFRAGANPKASYKGAHSHFSSYVEVSVAVIEVVLLVGFAIPAWTAWVTPPDTPAGETFEVRVVAQQFAVERALSPARTVSLAVPTSTSIDDIVQNTRLVSTVAIRRRATTSSCDQPAQLSGRYRRHRVPQLARRAARLLPAADAGEAGRRARHDDPRALPCRADDAGREPVSGLRRQQRPVGRSPVPSFAGSRTTACVASTAS